MYLRQITMKAAIEEDVLRLMGAGPVTIEEVARELSISWARAQAVLFRLVGQGKISHERKGRMNIFRRRQSGLKSIAPIQSRVKKKSLGQLAKELDQYWLNVSAQDIVEAERGHY
ncbi:MAG: hypothetical protein ACUVTL_10955 [Thermoproteota archaeon]